ncbi:MAG: hypothetical protein R3F30_09740 [Planctomycetota bacterium]
MPRAQHAVLFLGTSLVLAGCDPASGGTAAIEEKRIDVGLVPPAASIPLEAGFGPFDEEVVLVTIRSSCACDRLEVCWDGCAREKGTPAGTWASRSG